MSDLLTGSDDARRCPWPADDAAYLTYHDEEWGRPELSDAGLYERVALEGFQAGLSWITILRKRDAFRAAFKDFDPHTVVRFTKRDVTRLMKDSGIVRNEAKIKAAIANAGRALELIEERGSLAAFLGDYYDPASPPRHTLMQIPAVTEASTALSKALKARGWSFVGPTTMYALMQAVGLVNDHLVGCFVRDSCRDEAFAWWGPGSNR